MIGAAAERFLITFEYFSYEIYLDKMDGVDGEYTALLMRQMFLFIVQLIVYKVGIECIDVIVKSKFVKYHIDEAYDHQTTEMTESKQQPSMTIGSGFSINGENFLDDEIPQAKMSDAYTIIR